MKIVVGLGFGDEGKGRVVDYLCSQSPNPLVVRFNGGHQAGHTVIRNGIRHVFSNFGSGSIFGIPTYWSKFCTVDPIGLINEQQDLVSKGVVPQLYLDTQCPITTPYDIYFNRANAQHGSVGLGFGATIQREEDFYSLTVLDLYHPEILEERLSQISAYYTEKMGASIPVEYKKQALSQFRRACELLIEATGIVSLTGIRQLWLQTNKPHLIFEGAQGLLLDQHYGFFPHVTRSNTGTENISALNCFSEETELYLVTRAYQTRHGRGFMTNEAISHNILENPIETNKAHKYQGNFRRTLLDASLLKYALNKDHRIANSVNRNLVITCLDHIKEDYRFTHEGRIIKCENEEEFIRELLIALRPFKMRNVFLSHSDAGELAKYERMGP